jgi:two-component system chemotaxis response regulator CheY
VHTSSAWRGACEENLPITGMPTNRTVEKWRDTPGIFPGDEDPERPCVLVVDDDPDLGEMMAQLLRGEGFDTEVAINGQDALDKAHANPPQVILLDMMMPVMDGWTFLAHQRKDAALAIIPVIVLSAVPPARLANVGAAATLQKPFDLNELLATLRAHC